MKFHVIPRGYYDVAIFCWMTVGPDGGVHNGGAFIKVAMFSFR